MLLSLVRLLTDFLYGIGWMEFAARHAQKPAEKIGGFWDAVEETVSFSCKKKTLLDLGSLLVICSTPRPETVGKDWRVLGRGRRVRKPFMQEKDLA
jgi:hypothetical protein